MHLTPFSLISDAHAEEAATTTAAPAPGADPNAPAAPQMNPIAGLMPLLLIFAVFYFLLIRPQQKKLKEHQKVVEGLRRGDKVVTGGGILGLVTKVENDVAHIEIAPNTRIRVMKATIADVVSRTGVAEPANDKAPSKEPASNSDEPQANDN